MATFPGAIIDTNADALPARVVKQGVGAVEVKPVVDALTVRVGKSVVCETILTLDPQLLLRSVRYSPGALVNQGDGINKPRKVPLEYTWMKVN